MSNNLPGNPHAFAAADALRDTPVSVEEAYKLLAQATTQAALSVAFEIRTQTLTQINLHNRREAARQLGPSFEEIPEHVYETLEKLTERIEERLGGDL